MYIRHMFEVALETFKLVINIVLKGVGDVDMMAGHANLHSYLLFFDEFSHHPAGSRYRLDQALTLVRRRYRHRLAVFGHRPAGDFDALLGQDGGNLVVTERLVRLLGGNQFFNQGTDGGG